MSRMGFDNLLERETKEDMVCGFCPSGMETELLCTIFVRQLCPLSG
jgi:hypothetical protein